MEQKYKIMAYITAYEDEQAVLKCIQSLENQSYPIHKILVIDNSKIPTDSLLSLRNLKNNLIIEFYPENIGISGGLSIGIQQAINEEFDFLWTFDQDSETNIDTLEKLLYFYDLLTQANENVGIIAPLPVDKITGNEWGGIVFDKYKFSEVCHREKKEEFYECDAVITSGSLINLKAAQIVPPLNKGFFIDAVDWEYCMKFRECGYKIFVIKSSTLNHRFGDSYTVPAPMIFRRPHFTIYNYSALRCYYMFRNHTFVETRLALKSGYILISIIYRLKGLTRIIIKIIIYEKQSMFIKIWACIKGTLDGFMGKLGKNWN